MSAKNKRKPNDNQFTLKDKLPVKKCCREEEKDTNCFFKELTFFVSEFGIGKTRADLFKKQISKFGAQLQSRFSDVVSHAVVDGSITYERVCKMFGLETEISLHDFGELKIVKTTWVSACLKNKCLLPTEEYDFDWKTFLSEKLNCTKPKETQRKTKDQDDDGEKKTKFPKNGVMWRANTKRKEEGTDMSSGGSDYAISEGEGWSSDGEQEPRPSTSAGPVPQDKWICAQSSANRKGNVNEHITNKLQELATIYENTKDTWRALGYQKAIAALRRHPTPVTSFQEAKSIRGVGARLAEKIWEIVESGELRKLDELSSNEDLKTLDMFTKLWGAGPTTASAWVRAGFRTLDDLRTKANLSRQQKVGLKYYDELLERMPREEAAHIEATVKDVALRINPGLVCMACGSYRRGRTTCGDVDVLVTHPDGKSHRGVFSKLLNDLRDSGFLTDDLVTQEDNFNQKKYLGVCMLPGTNRKHRRLDIIVVPYDEFACALMYFTGSAHFNRSMRHLAGKMGMSLSEHSLNTGVVKVNNVKVNKGTPLSTPSEESVFEHLGLKYRRPEDRDHK